MVVVSFWGDKSSKEGFVNIVESLIPGDSELFSFSKGNESENHTRKEFPDDGSVRIFIWGSLAGENDSGNRTVACRTAWGIQLDGSSNWNWWRPSGVEGAKEIINPDNGKPIAEVVGRNLFVFAPLAAVAMENGPAIFRHVLEEAALLLSPTPEQLAQAPIDRRIRHILEKDYVYSSDVGRVLSLAFAGEKNLIVFGPAGHAKSAMIQSVIDGLGLADDTFFQFFGEGMDEARLFGGLNFRKLEEEKVLEYFPEKSFLNCRIAVFEELFDAPASVLLALKDVLTARELRNGSQRFKMKTEIILVLTNKDPDEISDLGPAAHALVERFPLQFNLKWENYSAESYLSMFEKVARRIGGPVLNGFKRVLAEILAKATAEGNFVSPRTAVHAYEICQASAKMRGALEVGQQDLADLRFLPGLEGFGATMQAELEAAIVRERAKTALDEAKAEFEVVEAELQSADTPIKALKVAKRFGAVEDRLSNLSVPDGLVERRDGLRQSVSKRITQAQTRAMDLTRI